MLTRYPHTGTIRTITENDQADGITTLDPTDIEVSGRYEPVGQKKALDYSAKWYCKQLSLTPFSKDGHLFIYNGKQFKIVQIFEYQTHCEIWLE